MADLTARLHDLRAHLDFPDPTGVAAAVHDRIAVDSDPRNRPGLDRRVLLVAAAVVLALLIAVGLAVPASRDAVADWLGLGGVTIETTTDPDGAPTTTGTELHLGRPIGLTEARAAVDFPVTVPALDARPSVYLARRPVERVSLLYPPSATLPAAGRPDVGLLVTELAARIDEIVFRKSVGGASVFEPVTVDGRRGFWIGGGPHTLTLVDPDGRAFPTSTRLAANTLLLEDGDRTLRIESGLERDAAVAIARSLLAD